MSVVPVKSLGQHFLRDDDVRERIADHCVDAPGVRLLEVGPGEGALTGALLDRGAQVVAVEADRRLAGPLRERFAGRPFFLHEGDILRFDLSRLPPDMEPLTVVGNLPYNISTPFLETMLAARARIASLRVMVQREFARRLVAAPGSREYSVLSCCWGLFATTRILFHIPPEAFRPVPGVWSSFLCMDLRPSPLPVAETLFLRLVRTAFQRRRKTVVNALAPLASAADLQRALASAGIDKKSRPEVLSPADYAKISICLADHSP